MVVVAVNCHCQLSTVKMSRIKNNINILQRVVAVKNNITLVHICTSVSSLINLQHLRTLFESVFHQVCHAFVLLWEIVSNRVGDKKVG